MQGDKIAYANICMYVCVYVYVCIYVCREILWIVEINGDLGFCCHALMIIVYVCTYVNKEILEQHKNNKTHSTSIMATSIVTSF